MALETLLASLEARAPDTPDTPPNIAGYQAKPAPLLACTPATPDTPEKRIGWRVSAPPLTPADPEHDGGLPRPVAEQEAQTAMRVYRLLIAMGPGEPDRKVVLLAPHCDLAQATRAAQGQFGAARVRSVERHQ